MNHALRIKVAATDERALAAYGRYVNALDANYERYAKQRPGSVALKTRCKRVQGLDATICKRD